MKLKAPDTWPSVDLIQMPSVIQLSFIIYNQRTCEITHLFNEYIDIDDRIFISDEVTRITGIDRDTLDARGIPMFYALSVFLQCVKHCDAIVAHNSDFDMRMIIVEMMRYGFPIEGVFDRLQICCTQTMGQPICRLPSKSAGWMKPPRLSELYVYLFGTQMDNLHNAIVDVLVCFRCFLKLAFDREMTEPEFQSMVAFNLQEP
jgi:DNA polymerase III epsilon subunit-like protein